MTSTVKLSSFNGVGKSQTATLQLPIGYTYHDLLISYSGLRIADIGAVKIVINGDTLDEYIDGNYLLRINKYKGMRETAGIMHLSFTRPSLLTRGDREISVVGTGLADDPNRISTLTLTIDIKDTATNPVLSATAIRSVASKSGVIRQTKHFYYDTAQAGDLQITNMPRGQIIDKIFFRATTSSGVVVPISSVELKLNNNIVFQRSKIENEHIQKNGVRAVDTDMFVYDPSEMGYGNEGLITQGLNEMRFTLKLPEACRITAVVEYFGFVPNKR